MALSDRDKDLKDNEVRTTIMRALSGGEDYLKGKIGGYQPQQFLPLFDDLDVKRYLKYVDRAVYYNFTGWTITGLVGSIFRKEGNVDIPESIAYAEDNIDGAGLSLNDFATSTAEEVLTVGNHGLLVDIHDSVARAVSYKLESIVSRRVSVINGRSELTQVVLKEYVKRRTGQFDQEEEIQYRVVYLDKDGFLYHRLYNEDEVAIADPLPVTRSDGSRLDYVPFVFCGAKTNKPTIDKPPLLDIGYVNLGHFRNSADYEENLFLHGQGTLVLDTGNVSNDTIKAHYPNGIKVGARSAVAGPGFKAQMLQIEAAGATKTAMDDKVKAMVGLGARFISESSGNQRVDSVRMDKAQKESGLSTVTANVEDAVFKCLNWMVDIMGGDQEQIEYTLNRDFFDMELTAQEASAMIMLADSGYMAPDDINHLLKKTSWLRATRSTEDIKNESEDNSGGLL